MMFPSNYFKRKEFACKCGCGTNVVDAELLAILDFTRAHFNKPVVILSGNRCIYWNRSVGGKAFSQHLFGRAADIRISGIKPKEIYDFLDSVFDDKYGLGLYLWGVHVDSRDNCARW